MVHGCQGVFEKLQNLKLRPVHSEPAALKSAPPEQRCRMNPTVDKENRQETQTPCYVIPTLHYVIPRVAEESAMPDLDFLPDF